jgi:uncharacterized protein (TIGR02145 family)
MGHIQKIQVIFPLFIFCIWLLTSCRREKPEVSTSVVSEIEATTAKTGGKVIDDGNADISMRGVCWSIQVSPTINDNLTTDGSGIGSFSSSLTQLAPNTQYFVIAYATNSEGTGYGSQVSFTTKSNIVRDIDGNIYNVIQIGTQLWMKENLKTTRLKDGRFIPLVSDYTSWSVLASFAYCWYKNDEINFGGTYGAFYNWYAVGTGNLCPDGWHVPTDADWTTLTNFLGGMSVAGGKMKESGFAHWQSYSNITATNESGFTGLPGAYRGRTGEFYATIGHYGYWWSSTDVSSANAWDRGLHYDDNDVDRGDGWKNNGISVRCIKD